MTGWYAPALGGAEAKLNKPIPYLNHLVSGIYQKKYNTFVRQTSEIRPVMVRLRNELEYEAFGDLGNLNHFMGQDGFIFDHNYVDAYLGKDYSGNKIIEQKAKLLAKFKTFCDEKGIPFLIATPPGKPYIFPSKLPNQIINYPRQQTNRAAYIDIFKKLKIPYIDFEYFKKVQDTTDFFIYPQGGLHWGYHAAGLAMDSIRNYASDHFGLIIGKIHWKDNITFSKEFKNTDIEMINGSNMLGLPPLEALPYPDFQFEQTPLEERPKILVIGDSYFKILWKEGFVQNLFHPQSSFWYYFHTNYSHHQKADFQQFKKQPKSLLERLETYDLILFSSSEHNLGNFGFQFFETCSDGLKR